MGPQELAAVLANDPRAVRDFVREYGPVLQKAAGRIVCGELRKRLEDLMQDLMLGLFHDSARVLKAWDPQKGRELKAYLRDFAEKRTIDWLRRQQREGREQPTDDFILTRKAEDINLGTQTEAPAWLEPLWNRFRTSCSAEDARLLDMFYVDQCSAQEIAEALHLKLATVYQRKHRLKEKLLAMKKELSEQGEPRTYKRVEDSRQATKVQDEQ